MYKNIKLMGLLVSAIPCMGFMSAPKMNEDSDKPAHKTYYVDFFSN